MKVQPMLAVVRVLRVVKVMKMLTVLKTPTLVLAGAAVVWPLAVAGAWADGLRPTDASPRAAIPDLRLPRPGNYTLDHIMPVPHGAVLDSDGRARRLADYTTGKVTLLAFVYTTCSDSRGCPLAMTVMHSLKTAIEAEPALARQLRFVSLSFDPRYDTPAVMRSYGGAAARADAPLRWHFLTTQSPRQLAPLLAGFGQDVSVASGGGDGAGGGRAALAHLLKLYLIDQRGVVREIYSPAFLRADTILADMRSLVAKPAGQALAAASARRLP